MHSPHDRLFHRVFSDPEQAAGEIRLLLPAMVGEAIDWTTLRLQPGSFVDEALEERPNGVEELRRSAALVTEVAEAPNGVAALSALVRYLLEVSQAHPAEFGAFFRELGPNVEVAYMTGADILRAEGEARGEARGAVLGVGCPESIRTTPRVSGR